MRRTLVLPVLLLLLPGCTDPDPPQDEGAPAPVAAWASFGDRFTLTVPVGPDGPLRSHVFDVPADVAVAEEQGGFSWVLLASLPDADARADAWFLAAFAVEDDAHLVGLRREVELQVLAGPEMNGQRTSFDPEEFRLDPVAAQAKRIAFVVGARGPAGQFNLTLQGMPAGVSVLDAILAQRPGVPAPVFAEGAGFSFQQGTEGVGGPLVHLDQVTRLRTDAVEYTSLVEDTAPLPLPERADVRSDRMRVADAIPGGWAHVAIALWHGSQAGRWVVDGDVLGQEVALDRPLAPLAGDGPWLVDPTPRLGPVGLLLARDGGGRFDVAVERVLSGPNVTGSGLDVRTAHLGATLLHLTGVPAREAFVVLDPTSAS